MSKEQRFGVGFHKLLEQYYFGVATPKWEEVELEGDEKSFAKSLLEAYKGRYPFRGESVIGVEMPFQLDDIHGVFDAVIKEPDGAIVIVEHKTTKTDFSEDLYYWEKCRTDWQVGLYQLAAQELFKTKNVRVLYDVIRVPQLRLKRGEDALGLRLRVAEDVRSNLDRYFGQAEIRWTDDAILAIKEDIGTVWDSIEAARFPKSRKCFEYRRKCDFYAACFEGASLQDERLFQARKRR